MTTYRYISPEELAPIVLDPVRSPVVALDSEFGDPDQPLLPTSRSRLNGLSLAGGTPETGIVGSFWHFGRAEETWPWQLLRDKVLLPIFRDPKRTVVMHPPKTDLQIVRARGVTAEDTKATIECTMSMVHAYNENLPKSLKDLADCLLDIKGLTSYKETQSEIKNITKDAEKLVKAILNAAWTYYVEWRQVDKKGAPTAKRKYGAPIGPDLDPAQRTSWHDLVDAMPRYGVKKTDLTETLRARIEPVIMNDAHTRARARFAVYGTEDALYTLGLRYFLKRHMPDHMWPIVMLETAINHPICTELEEAGLKIDVKLLAAIRTRMEEVTASLKNRVIAEWNAEAKLPEFNPGSHDQKAHILWNVWKLKPPKWCMEKGGGGLKEKFTRKADGLCKTDADILTAVSTAKGCPRVEEIKRMLLWDSTEHLLNNFVRPLEALALADPDHRVHSSFWPVGAGTGRFSSSDPNVENIPRPSTMPDYAIPDWADPANPPEGCDRKKNKDGTYDTKNWIVTTLRRVFIPADGFLIVSVDASQIENRIVAHVSQDPTLLALYRRWDCAECKGSGELRVATHQCPVCGAKDGKRDKTKPEQPAIKGFCLGKDIHAHTSIAVGFFDLYGYEVGREKAKAANHAASYGMGANTMARYYDLPEKVCKEALEAWHARHPCVRSVLHEGCANAIRTDGFVRMFSGHERHFYAEKLLMDSGNYDSWEWEATLREAVNVMAQGGTAALMKQTMLDVREEMIQRGWWGTKVRFINQVHDELVLEALREVAEEVKARVIWHMENNRFSRLISVPIIGEGGTGRDWRSAH